MKMKVNETLSLAVMLPLLGFEPHNEPAGLDHDATTPLLFEKPFRMVVKEFLFSNLLCLLQPGSYYFILIISSRVQQSKKCKSKSDNCNGKSLSFYRLSTLLLVFHLVLTPINVAIFLCS